MAVFGAGGARVGAILDELVHDRPVYLLSSDGHSGWANSLALDIAGVNSDTPDPVDGRIDPHPDTGELVRLDGAGIVQCQYNVLTLF